MYIKDKQVLVFSLNLTYCGEVGGGVICMFCSFFRVPWAQLD
jgi:hypothetical protein